MGLIAESGKRGAIFSQTINIASIGAGLTVDVAFAEINLPTTVAGVIPIPPATIEADLCVCGAWIDAGDIVLRLFNPTGVAIDPAEAVWSFLVIT